MKANPIGRTGRKLSMETFIQDLWQSLRMMRRSPGFTLAAVSVLALGIGANTAIFSVINTVLLKPLPYPDPDRLVMFMNVVPQGSSPGASPTRFNLWRLSDAVQDVSAFRSSVVNFTGIGDPEQLPAAQVSADFFKLFGAPVVAGRTFHANEDLPNGGHVVVLSEGFWKRRFGGDSTVVGRTLTLDGTPHVIVGVLGRFDSEDFQTSPEAAPDVWLPFQIDPNSTMQGSYFMVAGRLKPGVTIGAANAQLQLSTNE